MTTDIPAHWITYDPERPTGDTFRALTPEQRESELRRMVAEGVHIEVTAPMPDAWNGKFDVIHTRTGRLIGRHMKRADAKRWTRKPPRTARKLISE